MGSIEKAYEVAAERYGELGIDVEAARKGDKERREGHAVAVACRKCLLCGQSANHVVLELELSLVEKGPLQNLELELRALSLEAAQLLGRPLGHFFGDVKGIHDLVRVELELDDGLPPLLEADHLVRPGRGTHLRRCRDHHGNE